MKPVLTILIVLTALITQAQKATIKGHVTCVETKEGVPFIKVFVISDSSTKAWAITDVNGDFTISNLDTGCYTFQVIGIGFEETHFPSLCLTAGTNTMPPFAIKQIADNRMHITDLPAPGSEIDMRDNPSSTIIYRDDIRKIAGPR